MSRTYSYPGDGSWVHFEIPVGQHYTGSFENLVFVMDDDANAAGDARFRNLVVHEDTLSNMPPVLTITGPVSGSSYVAGQLITFDATASDAEEGDLSGQITWHSDLDGALGMGAPLSTAGLSTGSHTVTVSVTDGQGAEAQQQVVTVVVTPADQARRRSTSMTTPWCRIPGQDLAGGAVIEDAGNTLRLTGNTWKRMAYPYTVTESTVIEFDYRSDLEGEIHAIAFDNGETTPNGSHFFVLEGTAGGGVGTYSYPGDGSWVHFEIPVGQHYTGSFDNLVFVMDDDANAAGDARFRNLVVHEDTLSNMPPVLTVTGPVSGSSYVAGQLITFDATASDAEEGDLSGQITWHSDLDGALGMGAPLSTAGLSTGSHTVTVSVADGQGAEAQQQVVTVVVTPADSGPTPIDFNAHTLVSYPGQDLAGGAVIEDGGSTLRLTGNTWKRMTYPYTVTESTVIEFDYQRDLEGEIHAIAFDNGETTPNGSHYFVLDGTAGGGIGTYSYSGDGSWVHFEIPVGQHYTGSFENLVFLMDDDANAAGEERFRNLVVYDE